MQEFTLKDKSRLCQHYLNILYHDLKAQPAEENSLTETYGEILYSGVETLLSSINLSEHDTFVDLGSGLGKIITQIFLQSNVKEAWGIELLPILHQKATSVAQKIQKDLPEFYFPDRKLTFTEGDFLKTPLDKATVAIICSQCFSQPMINSLGEILNSTSNIHTVLTLRPITTLHRLQLKKIMRVECSWDTALCYIYRI